MNQNAALVVFVLAIFALAVFLAVHYAGAGADGSNGNGFGLSEFTIQLANNGGGNDYTLGAYSKLDLGADGAINGWTLNALVSWSANGNNFVKVMTGGKQYEAQDNAGVLDVHTCNSFSTAALTAEGLGAVAVAPEALTAKPDDPNAAKSKVYKLTIRGETFNLLTALDGTPQQIIGRDQKFTVTSFTAGANTLVLPTIPAGADANCPAYEIESKRFYNSLSYDEQHDHAEFMAEDNAEVLAERKSEMAAKKLHAMKSKTGATAQACPDAWQGDGYCDSGCNSDTYSYDGGDCCAQSGTNAGACTSGRKYTCGYAGYNCLDTQVNSPPNGCPASYPGDGYCDAVCNKPGLQSTTWDGGDCCAGSCTAGRKYACGYAGYTCLNPTYGGSKSCAFLHGAGRAGARPSTVHTSYASVNGPGAGSKYWGNFNAASTGCTTSTYTNGDTKNYGWNDRELQNAWYETAYRADVRFGHSMGNLIMAGACLDQGKCYARWYNLAGPMRGSSLADVESDLAWLIGNGDGSHNSLRTNYRGFQGQSQANQIGAKVHTYDMIRGHACGYGGWGSGGTNAVALKAAWLIISGSNDGLVPYTSCARGGNSYYYWGRSDTIGQTSSDTPEDYENHRYYKDEMNHQDLTGSEGDWDPWVGSDGFPVKYIKQSITRGY